MQKRRSPGVLVSLGGGRGVKPPCPGVPGGAALVSPCPVGGQPRVPVLPGGSSCGEPPVSRCPGGCSLVCRCPGISAPVSRYPRGTQPRDPGHWSPGTPGIGAPGPRRVPVPPLGSAPLHPRGPELGTAAASRCLRRSVQALPDPAPPPSGTPGDGGAPQLLVGGAGAAGGAGHAAGAGALPVPAGPGRAAPGVAVGAAAPPPRLLPGGAAPPDPRARLQPPDARADPELPAAGGGGQRPRGGGGGALYAGARPDGHHAGLLPGEDAEDERRRRHPGDPQAAARLHRDAGAGASCDPVPPALQRWKGYRGGVSRSFSPSSVCRTEVEGDACSDALGEPCPALRCRRPSRPPLKDFLVALFHPVV